MLFVSTKSETFLYLFNLRLTKVKKMLKGLICETKKENVTFEACAACGQCAFGLTFVYNYLGADQHDLFSVSAINGCITAAYWKITEDVYEEQKALEKMTAGQFIHGGIDFSIKKALNGQKNEFPVGWTFDGFELRGRIDNYDGVKQLVTDFKTTAMIPNDIRPYNKNQVVLYALLLHKNGFPVSKGRIVYLNPYGFKVRSRTFDFDITPEMLAKAEAEVCAVAKSINANPLGKSVPKPNGRWDYEFKLCQFRAKCAETFGQCHCERYSKDV